MTQCSISDRAKCPKHKKPLKEDAQRTCKMGSRPRGKLLGILKNLSQPLLSAIFFFYFHPNPLVYISLHGNGEKVTFFLRNSRVYPYLVRLWPESVTYHRTQFYRYCTRDTHSPSFIFVDHPPTHYFPQL